VLPLEISKNKNKNYQFINEIKATKMNKLNLFGIAVLFVSTLFIMSCNEDAEMPPEEEEQETVTDADGNEYKTITIGTQTWMLENLKTTKYNDGTPITEYVFGDDWHNGNTQLAYFQWASTYDLNNVHDDELPFDYYGAMYNHYAIETGKLAPEGWRIPTEQDFKTLEAFIAADGNAGNEATVLKTTTGWLESTGNGTDVYGFAALPNGYVSAPGTATASELICTWATTEVDAATQTRISINLYDENTIIYAGNAIQIGAGIRCIKE
jgi:uncharacterized protein (TIGR02145 family)